MGNSKARRTLPELVAQSSLPKSSVHSLLVTFERQGYIYRHYKTGQYMFGPKLLHLADTSITGLGLRELAAPQLQALANRLHLTTDMGVLENNQVWIIAKYGFPGTHREATWVGARMPIHCTGIGKAFLTHLSDDELRAFIRAHGLPRYNDNTLHSEKKLKLDLASSRERGFTISDEECELGSRSVGAPILTHDNRVIAAISIVGTTDQIDTANLGTLAKCVVETAAAISHSVRLIHPQSHDSVC
jgi:DNA-binding IclR family transcriptional regulator